MRGTPRIPGAKERWSDYRKTITDYVAQQIEPEDRILILGAGGCDDIDVEALVRLGAEIYLADVNVEAMNEVCLEIPSPHIHILEADFIGMTTPDYQDYLNSCCCGSKALDEWWDKYYYNIVHEKISMFKDVTTMMKHDKIELFDMVLCFGLHSQLYINMLRKTWMLTDADEAVKREATRKIQNANLFIAEKFMDEINVLGKKMVLGLEYTGFAPDSNVESRILNQLNWAGTRGLYELGLSRVEGSYQMEQYLLEINQEVKMIRDRQYTLWPFSSEKTYLMVIYWLEW